MRKDTIIELPDHLAGLTDAAKRLEEADNRDRELLSTDAEEYFGDLTLFS